MKNRTLHLIAVALSLSTLPVAAKTNRWAYWADHGTNVIARVNIDAGGPAEREVDQILHRKEAHIIWGLEVDSRGEKIYWEESHSGSTRRYSGIWSANLNGSEPVQIYASTGAGRIRIDPGRRLLFFADFAASKGTIKSLDLRRPANPPVVVYAAGLHAPKTLSLDTRRKRIVWTFVDSATNKLGIRSIGYNGSGYREEMGPAIPKGNVIGSAFDAASGTLFWGRNGGGRDRVIEAVALGDPAKKIVTLVRYPWTHYPGEVDFDFEPGTGVPAIYWADINNNYIARVRLDGTDPEVLVTVAGANVHPTGLAIYRPTACHKFRHSFGRDHAAPPRRLHGAP